ncbi:MAG: hypothetical protein ACLP50_32650 [Solirubrobacteraceae bacterium]
MAEGTTTQLAVVRVTRDHVYLDVARADLGGFGADQGRLGADQSALGALASGAGTVDGSVLDRARIR